MFQPISASERNCEIGSARLPVRFFGAACSMASRIAVSAMAAGVTITELRASGLSGGTSASAGRRSALGESTCIATNAPAKETTTTSTPAAILPTGRAMRAILLNRTGMLFDGDLGASATAEMAVRD